MGKKPATPQREKAVFDTSTRGLALFCFSVCSIEDAAQSQVWKKKRRIAYNQHVS